LTLSPFEHVLIVLLGSFAHDKKDGYGKLTYSNGDSYEGMFSEDNMLEGGIYKFGAEFMRVKDEIVSIKEKGNGVYFITYRDGGSYEGEV
jgi:hypothetical protein